MASNVQDPTKAEQPVRRLPGFTSKGGGVIPQDGGVAFTVLQPVSSGVPVLISVPHAGRCYPSAILERMRQPEAATLMLEDRLVDRIAEEIAQATGATLLIAEAPRAMLDLNRSPEDIDWSMVEQSSPPPLHSRSNQRARGGLGLVPRKLARVGEIWKQRLRPEELEERIVGIHSPYHITIERVLADLQNEWGAALLVDLHSMPPLGRQASHVAPAQYVLGDRFGAACAATLSSFALQQLGQTRPVAHNLPYAGGYILDRHGQPRRNIHALQLEVCRSLYLDARMRELGARHAAVTKDLASFIAAMADEITWLGRPLLQAAE